jgi:hypothetical protein
MSIEVTITGVDLAQAFMRKIQDNLDPNISKALDSSGDALKEYAQQICPIGTPESTGNPNYIISNALQRSIHKDLVTRPDSDSWEIKVTAGGYIVNPNSNRLVNYASPVEYGSSRQAPRGFIRPSFLVNIYLVKDKLVQAVKNAVEDAKT